ncbi:MAG: hypothetical protein NTY65_04820, partial [Planctomycetota bacterium]|nr:hypothetical protein [Planctomycetota bacterium]
MRRFSRRTVPAAVRLAAALAFLAALLCLAPAATAADKYWTDGTGQWDTSGNWTPSGQPLAGDFVNLTQSDTTDRTVTYYNTLNPSDVLTSLTIDATGAMTLNMPNSHDLSVTTEYVGYSGKGAVTQSAGTNSAATLYLGYNAAGNGSYTITGGTLSSSSVRYIGYSGTGTLNIQNGGQVFGTTSTAPAYLGYNSGSNGTATVDSIGSNWTNSGSLSVGYRGTGTLNIQNGGEVSNTTGYLGYYSGSSGTATVDGIGSKWTNSQTLYVGYRSTGTLNIQNGGQVSSTSGYLGYYGSSSGTATVDGIGSKWTNLGDLDVGYNGAGTLTVTNGGQVSAKTLYASPSNLFGNGTIAAQGAVLDADLVFDSTHGLAQALAFGAGG